MDKSEKRAKLKQWKQEQRAKAIAGFPLPLEELNKLFDHVDAWVTEKGCDHSLRGVFEWLNRRQFDDDRIIGWLRENGGYCDCEVIGNVEEHVRQSTGAA